MRESGAVEELLKHVVIAELAEVQPHLVQVYVVYVAVYALVDGFREDADDSFYERKGQQVGVAVVMQIGLLNDDFVVIYSV